MTLALPRHTSDPVPARAGRDRRPDPGRRPDPAPSRPRVLSVAGTDPTGGAGIQADLKAFCAHGVYGMAVTTALVAQNTHGVRSVHVPGPAFLRAQLDAVSDDVEVDAVKIGMVADEANARTVGEWLDDLAAARAAAGGPRPWVVLDPVMVATSGHRLLDAGAEQAVRDLAARADVVTPNLPELAVLGGREPATTWDDALRQATSYAAASGAVVLLKGGHLTGRTSPDALVVPAPGPTSGRVPGAATVTTFDAARVDTPHTHGTGCSLSAALAALRPQRASWEETAREAKEWLTGALRAGAALRVGTGRGPVDHLHRSAPVPRG
ncbi:bifunctional hydroxymethylpyrimidine kinase/phosphomethylpyrimidine kinase [Cellulosimicrobium funkei]|uniref:bifunctional hydroxymethylpyrimidine kinase/phosphomethylpyrimidine kinase n=1 Tax=Cellulosimicrobium funkei TaxID=264251 RepID=UPI0037DD98F8